MTLTLPLRPRWPGALVWTVLAMAGSLLGGFLLPSPVFVRLVLGGVAIGLLIALAIRSPRLVLYLLLIWLPVLGLVRRLVSSLGSASPLGDPLLLVAPAVWIMLTMVAIQRGAFRDRTPLATAVLAFTAVLAVSALNPLQGGLRVGLGGLLLIVVPMLAFWVGRSLLDDRAATVVVWLLGLMAVPAAVYGLVQTFVRMPSWDSRWVATQGYEALNVGSTIRAFASFSAASEYAIFLGVGILAWAALARRLWRIPLAVVAVGLLAVAVWYESSRGIIVMIAVALAFRLVAGRRIPLRWGMLVAIALVAAVPWVVGHLSPARFGSSAGSQLAAHQVQGLGDPFGSQSTLPGHITMMVNGVKQAVSNPVGTGVGAISVAAGKYGGTIAGTEVDLGNAPAAAGVAGLIGYLAVVVIGIPRAYRLAASRRSVPALAALGIILVTVLQWLNGGNYAVIALPWLFLGYVDAQSRAGRARAELR